MPIEKIDLEKDYSSGIVNALIKNSEKINEIIDFLNDCNKGISFAFNKEISTESKRSKFLVEIPDSDKAV